MNLEQDIVFLYIFDANDSRSTDEKIIISVMEYAKANKIPELSSPVVLRTKRGKPYIAGDTGVGVSVSHSGEWFVCALTKGQVGVDIEHHRHIRKKNTSENEERFKQIAKRFFHPDEAAFVEQDPLNRFYKVWTAKESYVKYTGTGMDETFGDHSVIGSEIFDAEASQMENSVEWKSEGVCFKQMPYGDGYTLCVCRTNIFEIKINCMK